jgi:cell division protein FtsN
LFDSKTYEPKTKAKAKLETPVETKSEIKSETTGGPTVVQGELPAPVAIAPAAVTAPPAPAAAEPAPAPKELPPPKPEKVITELPETAVQGRLWLKGLPEDSYVLQHGTFATVKQAKAAMNGKDWLANARVIPVFSDGKDEAEFALVTGPFRTKDRAQNTLARLKLSNSVSLESSAGLYKQALPPKAKP